MHFLRNFLILLLVVAGIVGVSVLLHLFVNEALGFIAGPLLLVMVMVPLAKRLRRHR